MPDMSRIMIVITVSAVAGIFAIVAAVAQPIKDYAKTVDGLTVYLGVVPAEIVKGQRTMHGGAAKGPHEHHIVTAIFDYATGRGFLMRQLRPRFPDSVCPDPRQNLSQ